MKKKDKKMQVAMTFSFVLGMVLYLSGLFLIFGTSLSKMEWAKNFFANFPLTNNVIDNMKLYGCILFLIGFVVFIISVILLYKNN